MKKISITILLVMFYSLLSAQDSYYPDRPGYSYFTHLVGLHQMDVEMGYGYNYTNYGEKSNLFYNTNVIRYGAFKFLEFRYQIDFGGVSTPSISQSGVKGVLVGAKVPIYTNDSIISIGIIGNCYLPNLGKPYFAIPNYSPSVILALQKSIGKFILVGNSGVLWDGINPYSQGTASFAIWYIPSKFGCFAETMCLYSNKNSPMNCGDVGVVYYLTDNIVADFSCGLNYVSGLNNFFVNSGISWRIPNKHK